ncbi:acetylornithine deacetylase [Acetobacter sp. AN02]|uniref:acetylornithine deacetylase n=1 Tax=Acetobacter sp. AN02 TaxID=2894186 RepID=UPI00243431E9|nr:acetylornithine deacetylase [Acetobacter sp. AN02]MDG6095560.1 acetylornithine deacetylase [Acetobacter sp. AN02]
MISQPFPASGDSIALLRHLVSFDTTSCHTNLPLIGQVKAWLEGHGVPSHLSFNEDGNKANLHAVLGPAGPGGIAFAGHVDTVPVTGQDWSGDPFSLREEDGRLTARGATDMKGFVACMLAAVPDVLAMPLARPVHLFLTFDEEITCDGARVLIRDVAERGLLPSMCVVGEPTLMTPVTGHKGRLSAEMTVTGRAGHSSRPGEGVNALHALGEAMAWTAASARAFAEKGRRVEGFEPPHSTTQIGVASGGEALNIIPDKARAEIEWRTVPGDDAREFLARMEEVMRAQTESWMKAADPQSSLSFRILNELPPLDLPQDDPLAVLVRQVTGCNETGLVSYGTEAGIYQNAGVPSIVCGPGDIRQAHRPDEWIAATQLVRCDTFLREMVRRVCLRP